jgi:hypothetical protein
MAAMDPSEGRGPALSAARDFATLSSSPATAPNFTWAWFALTAHGCRSSSALAIASAANLR